MSYCVNCGVELDDTADKCALCDTPVINPRRPVDKTLPTPYPQNRSDYPTSQINRGFVGRLITSILLLPDIVCFVVNVITYGETSFWWSFYIIGATFVIWMAAALPLFLKNVTSIKMIAFVGLSLLLYVFMISTTMQNGSWFYSLALPIILLLIILAEILALIEKKVKPNKLYYTAMILAAIDILCVGIEISVDLYTQNRIQLMWSLIVVAALASLMIVLLVIAGDRDRMEQIRKRLHR